MRNRNPIDEVGVQPDQGCSFSLPFLESDKSVLKVETRPPHVADILKTRASPVSQKNHPFPVVVCCTKEPRHLIRRENVFDVLFGLKWIGAGDRVVTNFAQLTRLLERSR
jgi:hypothetical protein